MPWYKAGTVNVTLNSNAVTGSGTAFIVNGRVGDAFRGPDGRWYEVTNVASNTAISIDPPYIGATASGGSYALAPMQGYVKDSADALRAIVNTYGAQLSALKTTGNYDVLPLSKGGTGGTDLQTARDGLGLGTAATATLTTSVNDSTVGRVLRVGDHGIGAESLNSVAGTTIDALRSNGFYYVASGANQGNAPSSTNGYLWNRSITQAYAIQNYYVVTTGVEYKRVLNNGAWTAWSVVGSPIVGTTSQSGGVPTGSIIERGTNSNGEYTRFADGTQICMVSMPTTAQAVNTASGTLFQSASVSITWPMPFLATPTVSSFVGRNSSDTISLGITLRIVSSTDCSFKWWSTFSSASLGVFGSIIAIGRWY